MLTFFDLIIIIEMALIEIGLLAIAGIVVLICLKKKRVFKD